MESNIYPNPFLQPGIGSVLCSWIHSQSSLIGLPSLPPIYRHLEKNQKWYLHTRMWGEFYELERQNKLLPDGRRTNPSIWICFLFRSFSPAGVFSTSSTVLGVPFQICSTDYAIGYASVYWAVYLAIPSAIRC